MLNTSHYPKLLALGLVCCLSCHPRHQPQQDSGAEAKALSLPQPTTLSSAPSTESAPVAEALQATEMQGPFSSLEDLCAWEQASGGLFCLPRLASREAYQWPGAAGEGLSARVLTLTRTPKGEDTAYLDEALYALALLTEAGWFVSPPFEELQNPGVGGVSQTIEAGALTLEDVLPGGAQEIVLRWRLRTQDREYSVYSDRVEYLFLEDREMLCSLNASGKPGCLVPLCLRFYYSETYEDRPAEVIKEVGPSPPPLEVEWRVERSFLSDGHLDLKPVVAQGDLEAISEEIRTSRGVHMRRGMHRLVFP